MGAAFEQPARAVDAAAPIQNALHAEARPQKVPIRTRVLLLVLFGLTDGLRLAIGMAIRVQGFSG